jgi:hypothetical protein
VASGSVRLVVTPLAHPPPPPILPLRCALVLLLLGTLALGCRSVWVHGVIETSDVHPLPQAAVALVTAAPESHPLTSVSDANGCFDLFKSSPRRNGDYQLSVRLPGYKPLTVPVPTGPENLLLVVLEPADGTGSSTARPITSTERYMRYTTPCEPLVTGSRLTLH